MWELMRIGIEMQQRMIEVHSQGLAITQQMLDASRQQTVRRQARAETGRAPADLVARWFDFWSWRI